MDNDFKKLIGQLEEFDREVTPKFWLGKEKPTSDMSFRDWRNFVTSSYGIISDSYAKKMYEAVVEDPQTHDKQLVQLSLCDILNKVDGSPFENEARRAIMRCVHSGRRLDRELKSVMDAYYNV